MTVYRRRIPGLNSEQVIHAMGIDDAYRVERVLAHGRSGVTELVTIEGAGPFVRKKIDKAGVDRVVWATLAEADCARLPQVVATYEMPDCFVAVYDYIPGESLADALGRCGSFEIRDAVGIARDVCEATIAMHGLGVMHLDITPGNIVVAADGAHLIDFGNAHMIDSVAIQRGSGERPLGTWGFAAPEQFFSKADARSDIYAIGRLLSVMLTGALPQEGSAEAYEQELPCNESLPAALMALLERAIAFEPSARYQTVGELLDDLEAFGRANDEKGGPGPRGLVNASVLSAGRDAALFGASVSAVDASQSMNTSEVSASVAAESTMVEVKSRRRRSMTFVVGVASMTFVVVVAMTIIAIRVFSGTADSSGHDWSSSSGHGANVGSGISDANGESGLGASDIGLIPDAPGGSSADLFRAQNGLEIVESGWSASDSGHVNYALTFSNTSSDLTIEFPEILITGRDEDGNTVFADSQMFNVIFPGESLTFGGIAGNGTKPATVEFSFGALQENFVQKESGHASIFEVRGVKEGRSAHGVTSFTGEVMLAERGDEPLPIGQVRLSLVLRDAEGEIVFGDMEFVTCPAEGKDVPFELAPYGCPEYASAEVVAMAW